MASKVILLLALYVIAVSAQWYPGPGPVPVRYYVDVRRGDSPWGPTIEGRKHIFYPPGYGPVRGYGYGGGGPGRYDFGFGFPGGRGYGFGRILGPGYYY